MGKLIATFIMAACIVAAFSGDARALSKTEQLGDIRVSVFAPDWTWQKRDINILATFENQGVAPVKAALSVQFPPGLETHFQFTGEPAVTLSLNPGETQRAAFTAITALDGVPCQEYAFALKARSGAETIRIPYPVRTIRGEVVNPGKWALYLPAGIGLVWSLVFALIIPRFAERGAWRRVLPAVETNALPEDGTPS